MGVNPLVALAATKQLTGEAAGTTMLSGGPALEGFARYERPGTRWFAEVAAGLGLYGALRYDASTELGRGGGQTLLAARTVGRFGVRLPLGAGGQWRLRPHIGMVTTALAGGQRGRYDPQPLIYANPAAGQVQQVDVVRATPRLGYEACLSLGRSLGTTGRTELGLTVRYTNTVGPAVATTTLTYDRLGVPQPTIRSASRLEAVLVGLAVSQILLENESTGRNRRP